MLWISGETQVEFPNSTGFIKTGTQNEGQAVVKVDHTWHVALFAQLLTALPNLTMQPKAWSNSFSSKAIVKRQ